jgi:hypothetical protein
MAYIVNKTDGTALVTITDGTIDNTTSLTLFGKSYSGFGELLNEDLVRLLENSASTSAPVAPLRGEIWFDTTTNQLKVYDGTSFKPSGGAKSQASQPSSPSAGDLWVDSDDSQLYFYNGSAWVLAGPVYTSGQTLSGFKIETITNDSAVSKVIASMYSGNTRVAILSAEGFTPGVAMSGFATISAGLTLNSTLGAVFAGSSTSTTHVNVSSTTNTSGTVIAGGNFLRSDAADTTTGAITVDTDNGVIIGDGQDLELKVSGINATIANVSEDGDLSLKVNDGGVTKTPIAITGSSGNIAITGDVTITGNLNVSGEYENTSGEINIVNDTFVKLNTGNAEADAGIIAETSDTDDARLFYDVSENYWAAGENASYSQIIRLADTTADGDANKNTKALKTNASGNLKVTTLTLAAVGSNISTSDTSNANVPSVGQVAESIKRWGGDAITPDAGSTGNTVAGARYVETVAPTSGQGSNGDLWFVREA